MAFNDKGNQSKPSPGTLSQWEREKDRLA